MASVSFDKDAHPTLFGQLHVVLSEWGENKKLAGEAVHVTEILKHPGDWSQAFFVQFPDVCEDDLRREVEMIVAWTRVKHVTMCWLRKKRRMADAYAVAF